MRLPRVSTLLLVAIGSCGHDFDSATSVDSVRILTTRATQSSPAPGESTVIDALVVDARPDQTRPMRFVWFPDPCIDPRDDAYYQCYASLRAKYPVGVDITDRLSASPTYSLTMPGDVITRHAGNRGVAPYGQAIVFSMACAGHVEAVAPTNEPEAVPFGCFDDQHVRLGPDEWVFAYATIFSYADQKNQNPTIDALTFLGLPVDPDAGITVDHCTKTKLAECPKNEIQSVLPDADQETNPRNLDAEGNVLKEQVYVEYFASGGKLDDPVKVIFDPRVGRIAKSENKLFAPQVAGEYRLWAVVHDDRGGVSWLTVPLHAH